MTSSRARLRFALVGCGRISKKHVQVLTSFDDAEIIAVCDVKIDRAERYAEELGVNAYDDMHRMLEVEKGVDVISVLTPSGYHPRHVIELARYGKPLVVEKPLSLRVEDADAMITECDRHGVRLFVVKQNRYNLPVQKLFEAVEAGRFGKLVMGTVRVRWCRRQDYYDLDSWRGTWALDGGVFGNQASHHLDLLQWLMGPVESVQAITGTYGVDTEAPDTGAAVLEFRNGAIGVAEATTCTRPKDLEGSVTIMGLGGVVEIGGFAVNKMRIWQFERPLPGDNEVLERYAENPPDVYGFGHHAYLRHVVESIRTGKAALVEGIEARKSVELIEAITESAASGDRVYVPFRRRRSRLGEIESNGMDRKWKEYR